MTTITASPSATPAGDARPLGLLHLPVRYAPTRAILVKEIFECFKYVIFFWLLIALFASVAFNYWFNVDATHHVRDLASILFLRELQIASALACPIAALLLGLIQVFHERAPDLHAFFLHRPLSRTRIFAAKSLAGLLLYFLSLGVPIALLIAYAAWSRNGGHLFDILFARSYFVDLFTGISYYFAGILVAQRRALLFASRLFPLAAAVAASLCAWTMSGFSQALLAVGLLCLLLGLAAWNTYLHNGLDTPLGQRAVEIISSASPQHPILRRLVGFLFPLVMVVGLTTPTLSLIFSDQNILGNWRIPETQYTYYHDWNNIARNYNFLSDGRVALLEVHYDPNAEFNKPDTSEYFYFDLAGNAIPGPQNRSRAITVNDDGPACASYPEPNAPHRLPGYRSEPGNLSLAPVTEILTEPFEPGIDGRWYYLPQHRYFAAYDNHTRQPLGTLGATGLLPADSRPQPFPNQPLVPDFVTLDNVVYWPRISQHPDLQPIFTLPSPDTLLYMDKPSKWWTDGHWVAATSEKNVYFFAYYHDQPRPPVLTFPISKLPLSSPYWDLRHYPKLHHVVLWNRLDGRVVTCNEQAQILSQIKLAPLNTWTPDDADPAEPDAFLTVGFTHSLANPLLSLAVRHYYNAVLGNAPKGDGYKAYYDYTDFPPLTSPRGELYFQGLITPAIISALLLYLLTRHYHFTLPGTLLWPLATLFLGPIGLLTFLFTQPLPTRVPCPTCHNKRLVTRNLCEHCRAPFPPPPTNGTEILAPTGVPA